MTTTKVVDASAVAALLFDETPADQIALALQGYRLLAPRLLYFEVANTCVKKARNIPHRRVVFFAAFDKLLYMAIEIVDVDFRAVLDVAERHRLSAYDASYLWLALEIGAELVTLDVELERAYTAVLQR